ncbi:TniQ family protein [Bradyrhizobium sp. SSUT18]|uniref:TniQ family protein n=1 Tax=Bradyrhizobium sp. SSUT18 TaxID=3040602 RepID=UPI00244B0DB9|nr:TniQ family protein [Bradyrhizobium sp. SSUT18]MDH2403255.1 TniQ family protein [Bradyrhizobium sp. SSUT18]
MRPLRHTVPLAAGETPASFVSRLAALHRTFAREFCLDMGTTFQKVVDGDPKALGIIAFKAGVEVSALAENAFIRGDKHQHSFRSEALTRDDLLRATVVVCPKCLAEDLAAAPRARPETVVVQRARWQIAALKTCVVHFTPLVVIDKDMTPSTLHDWAYHVRKVLPDLPGLVREAERRMPTGFETYVLVRAEGGPIRGGLIDSLPLFVAIAACELFGAVATLGRMPNLKTLSDEEWRQAGAAGFDIVGAGKPGIEVFLEDLQASYAYSRAATEGPQAIFGRIYQVLEFGREDNAYDPLRALVGDFILGNFPVGPGDVVFGKPVETRRLHSIRTLSMETGLHPKRLRKLLSSAGMLPPNADELADGNCLFDADKAVSLAGVAAAATLSVRDAGTYLNAPRVQRDMLYRSGLLVPRIKATDHGAADLFAPEDLDTFLARLLDGAVPVVAAAGQVDIPTAAKAACCGSVEIVQAVLDGRLTRKAQLAGERGYMAVLVDVEEVRALVRGADPGGLTAEAFAERLQTRPHVVRKLIVAGHLKTATVINPVNRCPMTVVPDDEAARFEAEFVTLFALARQQGRHHMAVKKEIEAAGAKPALDPEPIGATLYRRSQVENLARSS